MPESPELLGNLTEAEVKLLREMQARTDNLIYQIGQLEVSKVQYLSEVETLREDGQETIRSAISRLGIPDGVRYQIDTDGRIFRIG